ncbi:RNA polymerase sigma factor RpoE [Marinomonas mediterranea]|jgi:RNA polymerase, sigma-24 subunit, RpoE|uniref:RNA polymerase, sigma-24 subunit, ECF subfamily n=1 Tax=Marinomonas mediterranea (strain ATCC 700492 / JCM 21426 / NBRC 103028 / MMB-1) TaxID=717774 RepID=F2K393_MARM1|nr:RNA polymerase sigma factor RpoE [Marinomonas mediterranea]ADZ90146.1 RNA polymerase, sigma-24 subunit, ECF subfamily [Marinomonas mediterranea MMB-1]WCN08210.1 RNA polymerase sigma factor RpoE [Marinomonas mediterranea]WCN12277.1 RNA polymerase sigma factor RpoE [Marinomonas mediterranea]WCN16350.1 RNA polymerase sigma factor RpoE [Marinomonas mediterranea MMB-1]
MQEETSNDKALVKRVQQGDKRAFDLLVAKYQHKVAALIGRYIQDKHEVLDVSQDSFIKAYRAIDSFRGESAFYTWLYRIAVNTAKNHLVARSRRPPSSDVELDDEEIFSDYDGLKDISTPDANLNRDRLQVMINDAIKQLPEELRSALTLREFDGLNYEEIAQIMDCPIGTVRSRIFRARDAVEKKIRPLIGAGD